MAIRPKIKKSSDPWGPEFDAEMKAISDKYKGLSKRQLNSMRYSFLREFEERIKTVPKKVVQAKVKVNKNAPKTVAPKTGNVTVLPKGSKPPTKTNSQKAAEEAARLKRRQNQQKGGRSSRGGGAPSRGGVRGGGMGGGVGGGLFDQIK